MNRRITIISILIAVGMALWGDDASALKPPHNTSRAIECSNCHAKPGFNSITSFDTLCFNASGCHNAFKTGTSAAGKKRFSTLNASNRFGSVPVVAGAKQSSHGWKIPNQNPNAGATNWAISQPFNALRQKTYCSRCHIAHGETQHAKFLRDSNQGDKICFNCHDARRVGAGSAHNPLQTGKHYSHPVEVNYSSIQAGKSDKFEKTPVNPYPSNPSAGLKLYTTYGGSSGGAVICSTCHGPIHSADSNPYTYDNITTYSKTGNYSTSAGNLLRRYPATKSNDTCSSCHKVTAHKSYLCARCHAPHKKAGENNIYLVQENISTPNSFKRVVQFVSTSKMADRWTADGAADGQSNAVCQVCHTQTKYHRNYSTTLSKRDHNYLSGDKFNNCVGCHSHSTGFSPSCNTCHGYPPEGTKSILGGFSTNPVRTASGVPSAGVHKKHIDKLGAVCNRCHYGGMSDTGSEDTKVTMEFRAFTNYTGVQYYLGTGAVRTGFYGYNGAGIGIGDTQTCVTMRCHGDGASGNWLTSSGAKTNPVWFDPATARCGDCHGAKKALGQGTWPTTNAHPKHAGIGSDQYDLMCKLCHSNTVLNTATSLNYSNAHVNGEANVAFDTGEARVDSNSAYSGDTALNSGFGACTNTYCHSKGTKLSAPYNQAVNFSNFTAKWTDKRGNYKKPAGQMAKCNYCHGNKAYSGITSAMPSYANGSPKANSHVQHVVNNGFACSNCHYGVARNNTSISDTSRHVNRFYNISVAPGYSSGAGLKRYSSVSDGSGGACMNNTCHGSGKPKWGSTVSASCSDCHRNNTGDIDDFTFQNGVKAEVYSSEWAKRGHGRSSGTYPFSGNNGAGKTCTNCHTTNVAHGQPNYFRLITSNPDRLCAACHGSGSELGSWGLSYGNRTGIQTHSWKNISTAGYKGGAGGKAGWNFTPKCVDCHDPHGDKNNYMVHTYINMTGSDSVGRPNPVTATAFMTFTAAKGGTQTAWSSFVNSSKTGLCQRCHSPEVQNFAKDKFTNHNNGSRCTNCHNHKSGFTPSGCDSCHGNPPTSGANLISSPQTSGSATAGAHARHMDIFGDCAKCHQGGMYQNGIQNDDIDLGFGALGNYTTGKYTGQSAVATGFYGYSGKGAGTGGTKTCTSVKCHGAGGNWLTKSGGTPTNPVWDNPSTGKCGECHGAKKASGQGSWPTTNAHSRHAGTGGGQYDLMCKLCHNSTVLTTATTVDNPTHVNAQVAVALNLADSRVDSNSAYTGDTAVNSGFGTCQNLYCHSRGTKLSAPYNLSENFSNFTAKWSDSRGSYKKPAGQMAKCNYCHGNKAYSGITSAMPNYVNGSPKANSHDKHVISNGYVCSTCHYGVARNNTGISDTSRHSNAFYNISIAPGSSSGAGLKRYSSVYDGSGGTCMNNACHGAGKPKWGSAAAACEDCHITSTADVDNNAAVDSNAAKHNQSEWDNRGHGRASGNYPHSGNSGAAKNCNNCHSSDVPHKAANNPFRLMTSSPDDLCKKCHKIAGGAKPVVTHSKAEMQAAGYTGGANGWASWNFTPKCVDCHDPHGDKNNYMIHTQANYTTNSNQYGQWAAQRAQMTFTSAGAAPVWGDYVNAGFTGICQRCHTQTDNVANFNKNTYNAGHNSGTRCTSCHSHTTGFTPGESNGANDCSGCHSTIWSSMSQGNSVYHHVMQNASSYAGSGRYPVTTSILGQTNSKRRCLMCHVDHDVFRPDLNANSKGRAGNLRASIMKTPAAANVTSFSRTDFVNRTSTSSGLMGGLCLSCHRKSQQKSPIMANDGTAQTPVIPFVGGTPADYAATVHGSYTVAAQFATDSSRFNRNCTKCHNDTMTKEKQTGANQVGLHSSPIRRIQEPMGQTVDTGSATSWSATTIADSTKNWTVNQWANRPVSITDGTGEGQGRLIVSNTTNTLTVDKDWTTLPSATSKFNIGDPIEEDLCYRCHAMNTSFNPYTARDYFGIVKFDNSRAKRIYEQFNDVGKPYKHRLAEYVGKHETDEYYVADNGPTTTPNSWFNANGGVHNGCTDCHNPHAARKQGRSYGRASDTQTTFTTIVDAGTLGGSKGWSTDQWRGYSVRIFDRYTAILGQDRVIISNTTNRLRVATPFGVSNTSFRAPSGAYYGIIPIGRPLETLTGEPTNTAGNAINEANSGVWGVSVSFTGITSKPTSPLKNPSFTKKGASTRQSEICLKCHSDYGWGNNGVRFDIPDAPRSYSGSAFVYGNATSSNVAREFNPNNLSHHAIFDVGKNQPIKPNYGNTAVSSSYNFTATGVRNWPYYATSAAPDTLTVTSGAATLAGAAKLPSSVIPGWYVWVGAQDRPHDGVRIPVAGTATSGWFQITKITSQTQFNVTPANQNVTATANWAISAGLGNNFVPPYGPWSVIGCADCHGAEKDDPAGPHASSRRWVLKILDNKISFPWFRNSTGIVERVTYTASSLAGSTAYFCLNCHRVDVYGAEIIYPGTTALPVSYSRGETTWIARAGARVSHPPANDTTGIMDTNGADSKNAWGIACMYCHGGSGGTLGPNDTLGSIHGSNLGKNPRGLTGGTPASYSGRRLLNGAAWAGVTRSTTTVAGTCWVKGYNDKVNACGGDHASGAGTMSSAGGNIPLANYDYDQLADP